MSQIVQAQLLGSFVNSLVVLTSHGPDLVLAFHVPHGEIRSLVPTVSTLIPMIRIVATNSSVFQTYRFVVSLAASSPDTHILLSVLPTTHFPYLRASFAPNLTSPLRLSVGAEDTFVAPGRYKTSQHDGMRRRARPAAHSSPAPLPCNPNTIARPAAVPGQSSTRKLVNPIQISPRCFRSFCCTAL